MKRQVGFIVGCLLFMWADTALAAQSADESVKVSKVLTQLFDRPDARLTVDAVAVDQPCPTYHRHEQGSGHVWQGRFKAFLGEPASRVGRPACGVGHDKPDA